MTDRTLSVRELAEEVNATFNRTWPDGVWVAGEIASISRPRNGHVYFDLIEPGEAPGAPPEAKVSVVLFHRQRQEVNAVIKGYGNSVRMTPGVQIRIHGYFDYYASAGRLQLQMDDIDPAYTLGRIAADRDIVLQTLAGEGLLRRNASLPVPDVPLRVGLVTSAGSAGHADMMRMLTDSGIGFTVMEVDVPVQGTEAPPAIAAAIAAVAPRADVVVLARGGGSKTDLVAFDHEQVVRAVATCPRPVFTGIGHEINRSGADDVAHTCYATPTAAAEGVVSFVSDWLDRFNEAASAVARRSHRLIDDSEHQLEQIADTVARQGVWAVDRAHRILSARARSVVATSRISERRSARQLDRKVSHLSAISDLRIRDAEQQLDSISARIRALDPAAVLQRGWSITRLPDGQLVRSINDVHTAERIFTQVADGTLVSTVEGWTSMVARSKR